MHRGVGLDGREEPASADGVDEASQRLSYAPLLGVGVFPEEEGTCRQNIKHTDGQQLSC
jgi:hypothetical protein